MEYEQVRTRVRATPAAEYGAGATPAEIDAAEQQFDLRFPEAYRRFLADFGWASIASSEIFGLGRDVPSYLELVAITVSERDQFLPGIRHEALPVMNDGGGNLFCIDCSSPDGLMTYMDHEEGEAHVGIHFTAWLQQMISDA